MEFTIRITHGSRETVHTATADSAEGALRELHSTRVAPAPASGASFRFLDDLDALSLAARPHRRRESRAQ